MIDLPSWGSLVSVFGNPVMEERNSSMRKFGRCCRWIYSTDNVTFQSACWEQVIGYPGILSNFRPRLGKGRKLPCIKLLFLPSAKRFSASKKCFLEGIDLVAGVVSCRTTHHKGRSTSQVNWRIAILPTDIILSLHVFVAAFFLPILSTNFLHLES